MISLVHDSIQPNNRCTIPHNPLLLISYLSSLHLFICSLVSLYFVLALALRFDSQVSLSTI